jgi:heme exporter protein D
MDTIPIDDWEGASQYFTFGADSFGVWLFLALAVIAFLTVIVRAITHEGRSYKEIHESNITAPIAMEPEGPPPTSEPAAMA